MYIPVIHSELAEVISVVNLLDGGELVLIGRKERQTTAHVTVDGKLPICRDDPLLSIVLRIGIARLPGTRCANHLEHRQHQRVLEGRADQRAVSRLKSRPSYVPYSHTLQDEAAEFVGRLPHLLHQHRSNALRDQPPFGHLSNSIGLKVGAG